LTRPFWIRLFAWGGFAAALALFLFSDWHYSSTSGFKLYFPWEDCSAAQDPDRIISCAKRGCASSLRTNLDLHSGFSIENQVTYTSIEKDYAFHVLRVRGFNSSGPVDTWAVCVSQGIGIIKARAVTAEVANKFGYGLGNVDDL
jgi:hypothetical protein